MSFFEDRELQQAWEKWLPKVFGYFYKRINNPSDVEDLTAETMNAAFLASEIQNFDAYIWKVAHNHLVGYIRTKSKNTEPISMNNVDDWKPLPQDEELETVVCSRYEERKAILQQCVDSNLKSDEEKKLITYSIIDEKNSTQIGELLNIQPDTVRQRISRTLRRLKKHCLDLFK
jgi:RNA polymerase sigma factor (sigma-70 family)